MNNIDMFEWRKNIERLNEATQNKIASRIIQEYSIKCSNDNIIFTGIAHLDIFYNYFAVKGTDDEKILLDLLYKYDFEFSRSIHNAIYYMLGKKEDLQDQSVSPLSWPGIISYTRNGSFYNIKTNSGKIEVYRANEIISSPVFSKPLMNQCYERTYEFLKENRDYKAVISLMPDFFEGDSYHAYLEKDSNILDIASNAYYEDPKSIDTIFCGEEIVKLSYEQVEEEFMSLKRKYPKLNNKYKLHTLAVHYDRERKGR